MSRIFPIKFNYEMIANSVVPTDNICIYPASKVGHTVPSESSTLLQRKSAAFVWDGVCHSAVCNLLRAIQACTSYSSTEEQWQVQLDIHVHGQKHNYGKSYEPCIGSLVF